MKPISMVVCDLDGTLFNQHKTTTPYTRQVIQDMRRMGILFAICTGRSLSAVHANAQAWGLEDLCDVWIGFNGGQIIDFKHLTNTFYHPLQGSYMKEIIHHFNDLPVSFGIYEGMKLYTPTINALSLALAQNNGFHPNEIKDEDAFYSHSYPKLVMIHDPAHPEIMSQIIERAKSLSSDQYHGFQTGPNLYEYVDVHVSKINGIRKVCETFDFDLSSVMCFGDAPNDHSMLQGCGVGVAMRNSDDSTKAIADVITTHTNEEDGVAHFLQDYFLTKGVCDE